jgi:hypothetical protein
MLPERWRQLLTAYVDGELSESQRRHVERLVRRSPRARDLLRRLQQDAQALRQLPRVRPPADLADAVLQTIAARRLPPRRPLTSHAPARSASSVPLSSPSFPAWAGLAAAAAVLLVVGLGSYLYFSHEPAGPGPALVQGNAGEGERPTPRSRPEPERQQGVAEAKTPRPAVPREEIVPEEPAPRREVTRVTPAPAPSRPKPPVKPVPEKPPETAVFTSGQREQFSGFERVEVALPAALPLHELDRPATRRQLLAELGKAGAFRVELTCRNPSRAFRRVQAAVGGRLALVIDASAAGRLKKPRLRTDYALFAENLTAEELAGLLERVGTADRRGGARSPSDQRFDGPVVVAPLNQLDRRDLIDLLGLDPLRVRPRPAAGPLGTDLHRTLAEQTAEQVARALEGKGKPVKAQRSALVVPYRPVRPLSSSPEVKRFLQARQPAVPGTLQVLLVLRAVGG